LGDPLKGNLLLLYKPLHLEAQQVSTRIEVRRHQAPRVTAYDKTTSTEALQNDVDALDEARDKALERATQYQQSL
jgi:hypothetical protein